MINFAQTIIDQSQQYPDKIAIRDYNNDLTYGQLIYRICQTATGFKSIGLAKGHHVIISLEDCIDWPVIFLACIHQGIIPLPVSTVIGTELFWKIVEFSDCQTIITSDIRSQQLINNSIAVISQSQIQNFFQEQPTYINPIMSHPDATAYMNISSGSTGMPKIAVHRHQTLFEILNMSPYASYGMTKDSTILSTPKMSWNYGLQNSVTYTLGLGATAVVISEAPAAPVVFNYLNKFQPDIVISSPSIIQRLVNTSVDKYSLPTSIKHFNSSGEHLPAPLYDQFMKRFGLPLYSCIGMMETCTNYAANSDSEHDRGTVGKPFNGCKIKIVDDEIYVSSPANACYYYNNYEKTKQTFIGEWVKTGDRGYFNEHGNLVFDGRVDDVFKVNDLIVNPIEIEAELMTSPMVEQIAISRVINIRNQNEIQAFIVPTDSFELHKFKDYICTRLFPHQLPKKIHVVDSLAETITNKKDRRSLAATIKC